MAKNAAPRGVAQLDRRLSEVREAIEGSLPLISPELRFAAEHFAPEQALSHVASGAGHPVEAASWAIAIDRVFKDPARTAQVRIAPALSVRMDRPESGGKRRAVPKEDFIEIPGLMYEPVELEVFVRAAKHACESLKSASVERTELDAWEPNMQEEGVRTLPRVWQTFQSRLSILFDCWREHGKNVRRTGRSTHLNWRAGASWWLLYREVMTMRQMLAIVEEMLPQAAGLDESGVPIKKRWHTDARKVLEVINGLVGAQLDPPPSFANRVIFAHAMDRSSPPEYFLTKLERQVDQMRLALHPLQQKQSGKAGPAGSGAERKGTKVLRKRTVWRNVRWINDAILRYATSYVGLVHQEVVDRSVRRKHPKGVYPVLYDVGEFLSLSKFRKFAPAVRKALEGTDPIFESKDERRDAQRKYTSGKKG